MDANIVSIDEIFGKQISFRIPYFQRLYSWQAETQWKPLWNDIRDLAERCRESGDANPRPHFMGAIVVQQMPSNTGEVDKRRVIDGQQRLTTLQLVLRAAADELAASGEMDRSDRIGDLTMNQSKYSGGNDDNLVKIRHSNKDNRKSFEAVMSGHAGNDNEDNGIRRAYELYRNEIKEWLNDVPLLEHDRALHLETALTKNLKLTSIDLDSEEEPYAIFAALNDRGMNLQPSDIIKNTLMQMANVDEDDEKAATVWGAFEEEWWREGTKETNVPRTQIDRYLDHWLSLKTGRALLPLRRLVTEFSDYIRDDRTPDIDQIVNDLDGGSRVYRELQEGTLPSMETVLQRMHALKVGAPMASMLGLVQMGICPDERKVIVHAIESFVIRRHLAGFSTNALRDSFAGLVHVIHGSRRDSVVQDSIRFLCGTSSTESLWPSDDDIKDFLFKNPLKGNTSAKKAILIAIEQHLHSDMSEPLGEVHTLTLEHLMPFKWTDQWEMPKGTTDRQAAIESRKRTIQQIGNLTLVTRKLNSSTKNNAWPEKLQVLRRFSTLSLNKHLLNDYQDTWDEETIQSRNLELAQVAIEIWPSRVSFM